MDVNTFFTTGGATDCLKRIEGRRFWALDETRRDRAALVVLGQHVVSYLWDAWLLFVEKSLLVTWILPLGVDKFHELLTPKHIVAYMWVDDAFSRVYQII